MSRQTTAGERLDVTADLNKPQAAWWSWLRSLADNVPTAIVLIVLATVAYFGHRYDWKLPKYSALVTRADKSETTEWCLEHGVPEAQCVECRSELLAKPTDFGWCKEHGVSQCPLCHVEIAQTKDPVSILPEDLDRAKRGLALRPRAENNPKCTLYRRRLQFASLDAVQKAGIDVEPIDRAAMDETISANGEITYDQTRVAHLSAKSSGSVWRVEKKVGDRVAAGEILALIDAVDVGRVKAEFLEAIAKWEFAVATKERLASISEKSIAGSRILEAETAIREAWSRVLRAQQSLVNLGLAVSASEFKGRTADQIAAELQFRGLPPELASSLDRASTTSNLLPVRAPFAGVLVQTDVVAEEVVDTTKTLLTLADTTQMWLTLDVRAEDAEFITLGQLVRFRPSGSRDVVTGHIDWISTQMDAQTRTVKVRAVLRNAAGKLRDQMFGSGQIVLRSEPNAIVIPKESLQWDGSCHVVFVRDRNFFASEQSPKIFYPRPVRVGAQTDSTVEILAGVIPKEVIVTKGSGVLRGELLKNNLGAG